MDSEDVPIREGGSGASQFAYGGSIVGHILHERFLVEEDLTDHSLGGGFSVFLVKDVKNYYREGVLKLSRSLPDAADADGPSLAEVGDALRRIGHPNIEEFMETGRLTDGRPFALTRPFPAMSLCRLLTPGKRIELEGIEQLIEQIANGLAAAHSKGLLHCDVRPSNILVPAGDIGANAIKIINFGAAWPIDVRGESLADLPAKSESLYYAAPELLVTLGHRSPASDVYSLCVLVYRLMTGLLPFVAPDRGGMLRLINSGQPARPTKNRTDLPPAAENLILAGLDFEPVRRPQSVKEFGRRLILSLRPPRGLPVVQAAAESSREWEMQKVPTETIVPPPVVAPLLEKKTEADLRFKPGDQKTPVSDRMVAWALIILLMAGALSIPIGQTLLRGNSRAATIVTAADRPTKTAARRHRLRYWFEPQDQKGGSLESYRNNFAGDGIEQLTFASDSAGHAYVFYEFKGEDGRPSYELKFPAADSAEALNGIEANKEFKASPPDGRSPKAAWIVWTSGRNTDLESIRGSASGGAVAIDDHRRRLRHFLERNKNLRVETAADETTGQSVIEGSGDRIVYRIGFAEE